MYYSDSYPDNFLNPALKDSKGRRPVGMTSCEDSKSRTNTIQVDPNEDFTELQDTLWHEAKHAANRCTTLTGHWTDNPDFDYDNLYEFETAEELHLLRNNPRLDRFITARPYPWQK